MKYVIIGIIILIALIIVAFIMRRKHTAVINKLEVEKLQIQHKPILEQLTKVKQLNMNGETEEKFERWRGSWTEVMDDHMPAIDELLFDAEEAIDRLRFRKATEIEKEIESKIAYADGEMNRILEELDELIGSEELNRVEMEDLKKRHKAARKSLLAHQHSFGNAAGRLEKRLESIRPRFEEYDELTASGNYLKARETVLGLSDEAKETFALIEDVPVLLSEIQTKIPQSIRELRAGLREMEDGGYFIAHLKMEERLSEIERELDDLKLSLESLEVAEVKERTILLEEEINGFYDKLEKEVYARHYVEENHAHIAADLGELSAFTRSTADEARFVQQNYRLSEQEAAIPEAALEQVAGMEKRFNLLTGRINAGQSASSVLEEELKAIDEESKQLLDEQARFSDRLKELRVNETDARARLSELGRILQETDRKLYKANTPGIPEDMDVRLEEAEEQLFIVSRNLQEMPLNMALVNESLAKAEGYIDEVSKKADEMLENVDLIERLIQYGNRYRSNPAINEQLAEAEEAFHQCRYGKALEDAASAVEAAEPGALKKIEVLVKQEV
ncbi:septation ring formation regulator [Bhargavaea ginsengi]|uniref:Septation ring formation regulator EzrA n=1 Tax=Bhargavaea ginsengi TaxID=426757 RepID=A0A1H6XU76_9BACL|nr:septation ring formation regulator EzrA [Bhargavaea ginsengi]MCM3086377.1 septation ring formation regulator EzrA [Bhargavaea ginsengi]SEJ32581.1 septation ring formation regulator [Bhargavaea ginsengi]